MDEQPQARELKAQALVMLCANLPRDTELGDLETLADGIVMEIEARWKSHKDRKVRHAP